MGFLDILKGIGRPLAGLIPGGGTAMSILDTVGKVGSVASPILGGLAKGRAEGKQNGFDNELALGRYNLDTDRHNLNAYRGNLENADFNLRAPRTRLGTGFNAAMMEAGPTKINWGGPGSGMRGQTLSSIGGWSAAAADPRMRKLSDAVMNGEIDAQLAGPRADFKAATPTGVNLPKSSGFDKVLGGGSTIMSLLGGLQRGGLFGRRQTSAQRTADGVGL